jgi:hypothetical protein
MQRTSFDFDVITGPVPSRPAPEPEPKPDVAKSEPSTGRKNDGVIAAATGIGRRPVADAGPCLSAWPKAVTRQRDRTRCG